MSASRWRSLTVVALAALLAAGPAAAQWKWRDKAGRVQYSDLPPPPGVPERDILQKPPAAAPRATPGPGSIAASASGLAAAASGSAAARPAPPASDPELEARRRRTEQEAADKKRADERQAAAARADNCVRAREAKRAVDSGIRITRITPQGEREYLDDAARAAEGRRAQQAIDSECR